MKLFKDQRGVGHVVEIVIIAVIVLGVGGFIAWRVWGTQSSSTGSSNNAALSAIEQAIANAKCEYDDKDLCKFMSGWQVTSDIKVESTQTADGQTTKSTYISTEKGANSHTVMEINGVPYESITIGNTRYTKNHSDNSWWKETTQTSTTDDTLSTEEYQPDFDEPSTTESTDKTTYKKLGTEACGSYTCFKYQVIDPATASLSQYIWFDNQKYQMRRMLIEDSTSKYDQSYSYEGVSISAPSPANDLPAGYYLVPGSDTPVKVPTAEDFMTE